MSVRDHWPEYLIEAGGLALFMVSACTFGSLLSHPSSPVVRELPDITLRRVLMGAAMGLTAIALIYSPWGRRSGAHFNPATTLTFTRLGRVAPRDAAWYALAQFVGGALGAWCIARVLGRALADPHVHYVVTRPGPWGATPAFLAEIAITCLLMTVVLHVSNTPRIAHYTGVCAGLLVMTYISLEAPVSGMSMNPARTLASALAARDFTALWIYFVAPPLGMLLAAQLYLLVRARRGVMCAKLQHDDTQRCIFCEYHRRGEPALNRVH